MPLGCMIAVAMRLLVWPRRAADELRAGVALGTARAARLAAVALISYTRPPGIEEPGHESDLPGSVDELQRRSGEHQRNLDDAAREPGIHDIERDVLARRTRAHRADRSRVRAESSVRRETMRSRRVAACRRSGLDGDESGPARRRDRPARVRRVCQSLQRTTEQLRTVACQLRAESGNQDPPTRQRRSSGCCR